MFFMETEKKISERWPKYAVYLLYVNTTATEFDHIPISEKLFESSSTIWLIT